MISNSVYIKYKFLFITLISVSGMLISLLLFYSGLSTSLIEEKKLQSRRLAESGMSVVRYFYTLAENKVLSNSEAKKRALEAIKTSVYSKDGYYWINNSKGIILMHPYIPDLVGQNLWNQIDENGNFFLRNIISTAKSGGGWVEYTWPKPHSTQDYPKISYAIYFKPWDFILGTGMYLDDMEQDIREYAINSLLVVFSVTTILLIISLTFTRVSMKKLQRMVIRDPLTSLYTRYFMNEIVDDYVLRHERERTVLSVMFLDIDHFKKINDTYGHKCGDEVLKGISSILQKSVRPDDLCVRYGGEEFVIVMLSEKEVEAQAIAERICTQIRSYFITCKESTCSVTISVGIAYRNFSEEIEDTLLRADKNLYKAKQNGRDQIVS